VGLGTYGINHWGKKKEPKDTTQIDSVLQRIFTQIVVSTVYKP
jgi:hypothetical protein